MEDRWTRTRSLLGAEGCRRLAESRVTVVGLGGVGSYAAESLARCGIGGLTLIDHDRVAASNINRQLPALTSTLGQPKVAVMSQRIRDINPDCHVEGRMIRCTRDNINELLRNQPHYVVDAIDSVPDKVDLIEQCLVRDIPIVSAMGTGNRLDPTRIMTADIAETHTCPLARRVRQELRRRGIDRGVKVVFSDENPAQAEPNGAVGSVSFVPSVAGLVLTSVVVRDILQS